MDLLIRILISLTPFFIKAPAETKWPEKIQVVFDNTKPLTVSRGNRLPLYVWPAMDAGKLSDSEAMDLVSQLSARGIGLVCSWRMDDTAKVLSQCLPVARAQKKLGEPVNINATDLLDSFYNGDIKTAHAGKDGKPFFDNSFGDKKMGCPFTLKHRIDEIREKVDWFVRKYKSEGLPVSFIFTDWEVDGPLEVNRSFEASKNCTRCLDNLGKDFTFDEFQKRMREMRAYIQHYTLSEPVLASFPDALVGNYAVYPNDGYRYWYDYFEYYVDGQPYKADQKAKYRKWYNDFPLTGFTFAMPVVYPWAGIYSWYDFKYSDYRWFYNMLMNAGNAGKSTPQSIPVISFVHWHTIFEGATPDPGIKQMSRDAYQELLWHMLLRGTDTFFMWCGKEEYPEEVSLVQQVYADAQKYGRFLESGTPLTFDIPSQPGTVISGLMLGDSLLVRRTDFADNHVPVNIMAGTKFISVSYEPGKCKIIAVN